MSKQATINKAKADSPETYPAGKQAISPWRRSLKSALIWLLLFCTVCTLFAILIPNKSLSASDGVTGTFRVLVTKLSSFLESAEHPDVVILGSSLVLVPAVRCDDRLSGKPPCYDRWYYDRYIPEYEQSVYLQKLFNDKFGSNLSFKNLGVASSIMSDQEGIFSLLQAEKKEPRLLILGLAPRDFLDNSQQKCLDTPTRLFMQEYGDINLIPASFSLTDMQVSTRKIKHQFEKVLARIRTTCTKLACSLSKHKAEANYSNGPASVGERPNSLKDLATYQKLYNPPNFTMLEQQSAYLRALLQKARADKVAVLIINMPLTVENTNALDPKALAAYKKKLGDLSAQYGAGFLDIGSGAPGYSLKDFEDCCHLNAQGGDKLYSALVSYVDSNKSMKEAIKNSTAR